MRITYNWLKEFVNFEWSPEELKEVLNYIGISVEEIIPVCDKLKNKLKAVRIEKVLNLKNNLNLCKINDGERIIDVVCGAKNVREGMLTIYAPPGTEIKGEIIKIREFGNVKSEGMLLSFEEIGVGEEREGIIEIYEKFELGEDPLPKIGLPDYVYELEITPNRHDLLGIIGIAREISAYNRRFFSLPKAEPEINLEIPEFEIIIEDFNLCPRYTGRIIRDVKVKKSPLKIMVKLLLSGIKSINNVVDITNLVMLEVGQPLHAFDLDKLKEKIMVRRAKKGEKILCLDGILRELDDDILVIADKEGPVAIAGIIGGEDTKIDENTKNVFLESAFFNSISIRKSSKKLKITTESSYRFERGTWWDGVLYASDRASYLMGEICGGKIGILSDIKKEDRKEKIIFLREERIEKVLGEKISIKEAKEILHNLGLRIKFHEGDKIFFTVPSFRNDLEIEEDLIEEIARHYGYERIKGKIEKGIGFVGKRENLKDRIREFFVNKGFYECISVTFIGEKDIVLSGINPSEFIPLKNPLSQRHSHLRRYLFNSLIYSFLNNVNKGEKNIKIFEIGNVFEKKEENYKEYENLCILMGGEIERNIFENERKIDFYDLKGVIDTFFDIFPFEIRFEKNKFPFLKNGFLIYNKNELIGFAGILSKKYNEFFDIPYEIEIFEINLNAILKKKPEFKEIPRFPPLFRDLSFLSPENISYKILEENIKKFNSKYLEKFYPIDIFKGKPIPEGMKNITIRCIFRKKEGTLKEEEVEKEVENLLKYIEENTPFKFRR